MLRFYKSRNSSLNGNEVVVIRNFFYIVLTGILQGLQNNVVLNETKLMRVSSVFCKVKTSLCAVTLKILK